MSVQHRRVGVAAVDQQLDPVARDRPSAGRAVERAGDRLDDAVGRGPGHAGPSPRTRSCGRSAASTNAMCSSSGTPSSAAPWMTSSRLTPRANALSLSFFLTLTRPRGPGGSATAAPGRRPPGTRTARPPRTAPWPWACRAARRCSWRVPGSPAASAPAARARPGCARPSAGCSSVGRVRGVGIALVVEVVQQADQPPGVGVLARTLGHRAHRDLDRVHVLPQRVRRGVLVHQREGSVAVRDMGSGWGLRADRPPR